MNVPTYELDGSELETIELPSIFETPYRPDLIRQAVTVAEANAKQPDGTDPYAGLRTSAESFGSGRGMAMVPRSNNRGRRVPQTVGGRKAHAPTAQQKRSKAINDKERKLAIASALAATTDAELVRGRGHELPADLQVPVVMTDEFETLEKTREAVDALNALGLYADVERADRKRNQRSGRGTMRGRPTQGPKSLLVVTSSEAGPSRAARNLAGVDVATAREVNASELAPGGDPGRLTVFTQSAIAEVADR